MYISVVENTCFVRGVYNGENYTLNPIFPKTLRRETILRSGPLKSPNSLVCMTSEYTYIALLPDFRAIRDVLSFNLLPWFFIKYTMQCFTPQISQDVHVWSSAQTRFYDKMLSQSTLNVSFRKHTFVTTDTYVISNGKFKEFVIHSLTIILLPYFLIYYYNLPLYEPFLHPCVAMNYTQTPVLVRHLRIYTYYCA